MASRAPKTVLKTMEELLKLDRESLLNEARKISKKVSQRSWRIRTERKKYSGALMNLIDAGYMHINKKMSRNELLHEAKKGLDFINAETSTITGITAVEERVEKGLKGQNVDIEDWNDYQKKRFFRAFKELTKLDSGVANKLYKYEVMEQLAELQASHRKVGVQWLVDQMESKIEEIIGAKAEETYPEDAFNAKV